MTSVRLYRPILTLYLLQRKWGDKAILGLPNLVVSCNDTQTYKNGKNDVGRCYSEYFSHSFPLLPSIFISLKKSRIITMSNCSCPDLSNWSPIHDTVKLVLETKANIGYTKWWYETMLLIWQKLAILVTFDIG